MSFKAVNSYGMDAELAQRMASKYDKALEERIQVWIEGITNQTFDKPFGEMLQNGIVLCELVNAIMPGRVKKINRTGGLFRMQENVTNFIKVCREVGVPEASLFPTESLAQLKDVGQVLVCINAFSNTIQRRKQELGVTYSGPFLGPPIKVTNQKTVKGKWTVKPGGSGAVSKINQGSRGIMEESKYVDAREQIKRGQLGGAGTSNDVSMLNKGSQGVMEETKYVDAREQIKRGNLGGAGSSNATTLIGQGSSATMEATKYSDVRENIKRNNLEGAGTGGPTRLNEGSKGMERQQYTDVREQIKRGEM